jgi:hypothetical protein
MALRFKGVAEYFEDLVTFIDAPRVFDVRITFFNEIDFDCRRLAKFIDRTPTLRAGDEAYVLFTDSIASVKLDYQSDNTTRIRLRAQRLLREISCREPDWQLSSIEQVCNSSWHSLSTVEDLYIELQYSQLVWKGDAIENTLWVQLLLPFTAVKSLYLSKEFAPGIAAALQELGGITQVLPSLQEISVRGLESSGPFHEKIAQFVAARQLSDQPISISEWKER